MRLLFPAVVLVMFLFTGCANATTGSAQATRSLLTEPVPDITVSAAEDDSPAKTLGSFSTEFNANNKRRTNNIVRASEAIDRHIVQPGETFSYNETVGPTSKENGYQLSTIFIKGKQFEGYGGGVCQVSSTLYNAAANAGMTIVERHDHSKPVPYVEKGKDAATSYGGIDFKFENNKTVPVKIESHVDGGTISIAICAV